MGAEMGGGGGPVRKGCTGRASRHSGCLHRPALRRKPSSGQGMHTHSNKGSCSSELVVISPRLTCSLKGPADQPRAVPSNGFGYTGHRNACMVEPLTAVEDLESRVGPDRKTALILHNTRVTHP
eukprot:1102619-Rhodomonas_salina.1